jgi:hypothetical protein
MLFCILFFSFSVERFASEMDTLLEITLRSNLVEKLSMALYDCLFEDEEDQCALYNMDGDEGKVGWVLCAMFVFWNSVLCTFLMFLPSKGNGDIFLCYFVFSSCRAEKVILLACLANMTTLQFLLCMPFCKICTSTQPRTLKSTDATC